MRRPTAPRGWQRLSLRTKTMIVTALPVAVILVAIPLLLSVQRDSADVDDAVEHVYRVRQSLAVVLQDLVDAETGVRGYLLTGHSEFLAPYRIGLGALDQDLAQLGRRLGPIPQMRAGFEELRDLVAKRVEILQLTRTFAAETSSGPTLDATLERGRLAMNQVRAAIDRLDAGEATRLAAERQRSDRARRSSSFISIVAVPIGVLLTLLLGLAFTTRLVRSVRRIEENARRLERGEPLLDPPRGADELARLGQVLAQAGERLAEQESELRELALVDDLTGLPNRRAFMQIAEHELQVAIRRSSVTALLFVDADGLKVVNDRFGHAQGDEMLKEIGDVLRTQLRSADLIARIGGDEFVVLLSRDSVLDGSDVLQRLSATLDERSSEAGRRYRLDFSVGVAFFDPADPVTVDELIEKADAEMYQQKRAKRLTRGEDPSGPPPTADHPVWKTGVDAGATPAR